MISICNAIWSPGTLCSERATQSVDWGLELIKEWNREGWGLALSLGWAPGRSSSSGWLPPVFQCCEKEKSWEKGKEKGKRKERTRKKEKDTCDGVYPKSMGRKENQKIRLKKKKWNEPQQKEKGDAEKCGQKTKQNQHSHRKRRGEEKWR